MNKLSNIGPKFHMDVIHNVYPTASSYAGVGPTLMERGSSS